MMLLSIAMGNITFITPVMANEMVETAPEAGHEGREQRLGVKEGAKAQ